MAKRMIASFAAAGLVAGATAAGLVAASGSSHHRALLPLAPSVAAPQVALDSKSAASSPTGAIARPFVNTQYVLKGTLPLLDADSHVWRIAKGPIDVAAVATLAKALGLGTTPTDHSDGTHHTVTVGPNDGSQPSLMVDERGGQHWWFDDPSGNHAISSCAIASPTPPGTFVPAAAPSGPGAAPSGPGAAPSGPATTFPECAAPTPPTGVPTKDEAVVKAKALVAAAGLGDLALQWSSDSSEWSANAHAQLTLDGVVTDEQWVSFGFGGDGKLQFASGLLGRPERVDAYPRIGTAKGFDMLKSSKLGYPGGLLAKGSIVPALGPPAPAPANVPVPGPAPTPGAPIPVPALAPGHALGAPAPAPTNVLVPAPAPASPVAPGSSGCVLPALAASSADTTTDGTTTLAPTSSPDGATAPTCRSHGCQPAGLPNSCAVPQLPPVCVNAPAVAFGGSCEPVAPLPINQAPQTFTVAITGVTETLSSVYGTDEGLYLVPSYRFTDDKGGWYPVMALDNAVIAPLQSTGVDPIAGSGGVTTPGGPIPAPSTAASVPAAELAPTTAVGAPTTGPTTTMATPTTAVEPTATVVATATS